MHCATQLYLSLWINYVAVNRSSVTPLHSALFPWAHAGSQLAFIATRSGVTPSVQNLQWEKHQKEIFQILWVSGAHRKSTDWGTSFVEGKHGHPVAMGRPPTLGGESSGAQCSQRRTM
jgi:hypothetical protein